MIGICIDPNASLKRQLEICYGLEKYCWIVGKVQDKNIDLTNNVDFQRIFNGYYQVRRNGDWRRIYYECFQNFKNSKSVPSFDEIMDELFVKLKGRVEPSFSSKMLASLDPTKPIWDSYILSSLKSTITIDKIINIDNAKVIYREICQLYDDFLKTSNAKQCIDEFDLFFPKYKEVISEVKKIDFFLWTNGNGGFKPPF